MEQHTFFDNFCDLHFLGQFKIIYIIKTLQETFRTIPFWGLQS